jgi:hypothetical protein
MSGQDRSSSSNSPTKVCFKIKNDDFRGLFLSFLTALLKVLNLKSKVMAYFLNGRTTMAERQAVISLVEDIRQAISSLGPTDRKDKLKYNPRVYTEAEKKKLSQQNKDKRVDPVIISSNIGPVVVSVEHFVQYSPASSFEGRVKGDELLNLFFQLFLDNSQGNLTDAQLETPEHFLWPNGRGLLAFGEAAQLRSFEVYLQHCCKGGTADAVHRSG